MEALVYLHDVKQIVHRNLKSENILKVCKDKDDLRVKIIDFGFASIVGPEQI